VRRVRRLNGERRGALLAALRRAFADRIVIEGADAGLHVVVWFKDLSCPLEDVLIDEARRAGVGVHPISPLYAHETDGRRSDRIGLVMGYSALTMRQIENGVRLLAGVVQRLSKGLPRQFSNKLRKDSDSTRTGAAAGLNTVSSTGLARLGKTGSVCRASVRPEG